MIRKSLTLLLSLAVIGFSGGSAQAQSAILYVSPNRVTLAPQTDIAVLNVSNQSDEERRYDLTMVEQIMTNEGMTARVDQFEYSAKRMLRFVPKRFTLKPGERQTVRVMAKRPANLEDGDYHSHLLFREIPVGKQTKEELQAERSDENKAQFDIRAVYGVAVPIIVQKGTLSSEMHLGNASYVPAADGAPAHLAVELLRSGNAEASSRLLAVYHPASGEDVVLADNLWIPIYREVDNVTKRFPLDKISNGLSGGKVSLTLTTLTGNKTADGKDETISESKEISF
jgi:hypothetical protein